MSRGLATWGLDFEKIAGRVPLGRVGGASDMAGVCLFLASPAAAWISGAIVPVDGGHLARGLDLPAGEPSSACFKLRRCGAAWTH